MDCGAYEERKENQTMQPLDLIRIVRVILTIYKARTRQTGTSGECQFRKHLERDCFIFQTEVVKMFMRLLTQASIIYTRETQVATFDVALKKNI